MASETNTSGRTPWSKLTEDQKKSIISQWSVAYRSIYGSYKATPDLERVKYAYENGLSTADFALYIKDVEQAKWLKESPAAEARRAEMVGVLADFYGDAYNFKGDRELTKILKEWMLAEPKSADISRYITKLVLNTKSFKELPNSKYFGAWLQRTNNQNVTDVAGLWKQFQDQMGKTKLELENSWKEAYGLDKPLPEKYLDMAMSNGWNKDSPEWTKILISDPGFADTNVGKENDHEFMDNWQSVFGNTPPPAGMIEKYRVYALQSGSSWEGFFASNVKDTAEFKGKFPGYEAWENAQHAKGYFEGDDRASVSYYLQTRAAYIETYKDAFGVDKNPDESLVTKALEGNWSAAQFESYIMSNDPARFSTPKYQAKVEEFNSYWNSVMGTSVQMPGGMADAYAASGNNDPSSMWNQIKNSTEFAIQFPNWDAFEQGAASAGINVVENPLLYNKYKSELEAAFTNIGMTVPTGFEKEFFATGLNVDVAGNLEIFEKTNDSYDWQTGTQVDATTAAGIGSQSQKASSADLRRRMKAALDQHRAYAGSKFQDYRVEENKTGDIVRKI